MPYTIRRIDDRPIIVVTISNPIDAHQDFIDIPGRLYELGEVIPEQHIYVIIDVTDLVMSFGDVVRAMGAGLNPHTKGLGPERTRSIIVGGAQWVGMVVKAAKQLQYGNLHIERFDTLDEALDYAQGQAAHA